GKIAYMSPEQILRAPVDRRADVFAASIVLWELLTGKRLFAADDHAAVLHRVLHDDIEPPSVHVQDLPAAVDAIVMKGLSRDVSQRFATAHEMAIAIEASAALTRPAEIGAWVERTAGPTLRQRADRIVEIEAASPAWAAPAISPPELGADRGGEPTMLLREPDAVDDRQDSRTKSPRRHWRTAALAFVVAAGIFFFAASRLRKATPGSVAPVVSAVAASAEPNPPLVGAAPVAPPSSVPPAASALPEAPRAKRAPRRNVDCNPPYYFDDNGVKRFKPKCL
ncbi:MAG: serine/threonine protein kinase, partial [Labilithrix sp.]|nr:serine/threonine protein kinase [Labilithrix sp.]